MKETCQGKVKDNSPSHNVLEHEAWAGPELSTFKQMLNTLINCNNKSKLKAFNIQNKIYMKPTKFVKY